MQLLKKHIKTRALVASIYFISLLIIGISFMQFWNYRILERAKNEEALVKDVKWTYEAVWEYIMMSDLGIRAMVALDETKLLEPHNIAVEIYGGALADLEQLLTDPLIFDGFDVKEEFYLYREGCEAKMEEADYMIELFRQGDKEKAKELLRKDAGDKLYQNHYAPLKDKLYTHLDEYLAHAKTSQNASMLRINIMQLSFLLLALPILLMKVA